MGWFWGSEASSTLPTTVDSQVQAPELHQWPQKPLITEPAVSKPLSRDEEAEAEFRSMMQELNAMEERASPRNEFKTREQPESLINTSSIHPNALYPKEMSCRAAFDSAFYCQSLGGQWANVYRYGNLRSCSDQWRNFWFCMRTNRGYMSDEVREKRIQMHYKMRDEEKYGGKKPNSEDVWRIRDRVLPGAFEADLDAYERVRQRHEEMEGQG
ncbi:hypothetical protein MMC25_006908 [Agyrium rufum]|nr:hypothetical protein [Agyrium rufum]